MYKIWLKTFLSVFAGGLFVLLVVNAIADPMLVLPFVHGLNNRVRFINERQQKTNLVYFSYYYGTHDFDGIIVGSSRTSALHVRFFAPQYEVFNYASAAMRPQEFVSYLQFAQQQRKKPLRLIVIGLDFMGANGNKSNSRIKGEPVSYTKEVQKTFYALANLINLKAFHLSTRIFRANLHPTKESYFERRANSTIEYIRADKQTQQHAFDETMRIYREVYTHFHYNPDYKQILLEIKNNFPQTRFVVFTTPVAKPHLDMLFEAGLQDDYKQWLRDMVDVFGTVTHFMDDNEITRNYKEYFSDSHHLYPTAADFIGLRLTGAAGVPEDFGKVLTAENLPDYVRHL